MVASVRSASRAGGDSLSRGRPMMRSCSCRRWAACMRACVRVRMLFAVWVVLYGAISMSSCLRQSRTGAGQTDMLSHPSKGLLTHAQPDPSQMPAGLRPCSLLLNPATSKYDKSHWQ
eukprot:scaffold82955_cov20-Tisochrysis_lutea.AAC.1